MSCRLGDLFTAAELAAADQLVQLSGGTCEDEASSSSSSSWRSVNTAAAAAAADDEEEEDPGLDRRARKRYRLVSELYAATAPVKSGAKRKREETEMS